MFPLSDQWTAVRNKDGTKDYIQIGENKEHPPGVSYLQAKGHFPNWGTARYDFQQTVCYIQKLDENEALMKLMRVGRIASAMQGHGALRDALKQEVDRMKHLKRVARKKREQEKERAMKYANRPEKFKHLDAKEYAEKLREEELNI